MPLTGYVGLAYGAFATVRPLGTGRLRTSLCKPMFAA
jgi:hypothetical protein